MSQTKFDNITKSALWTAYNNICFYCNRPLDWDHLNIDHIIPESLADKSAEFEKIIVDYELPDDFNLNGLYNLVPTHGRCNLRKANELFAKTTTLFYLGLTNKKQSIIKSEIEKLRRRKNKGQIISKLQSAIATNLIELDEVKEILRQAEEDNWRSTAIKLSYGVEFIDEVYDHFYFNADCSELYDRKLLVGGVYDYLELDNDDGRKLKVSTLSEWQTAMKNGFYPRTNFAIKLSHVFSDLEELLEALEKAKMPKVSFISEPWIDIGNLDYLSPNIILDFEGRLSEYADKGASIGDLVRQGIIKQNFGERYAFSLEYLGFETSLREEFRADFNNDGIEDIFAKGWTRAVGGTLGYGFTAILTRYSNRHLVETIK